MLIRDLTLLQTDLTWSLKVRPRSYFSPRNTGFLLTVSWWPPSVIDDYQPAILDDWAKQLTSHLVMLRSNFHWTLH